MLHELTKYIQVKGLYPSIFLINKPIGFASFTIVDLFKKILNNKVGHAGTLDPLATGDLLILTGHTTKLTNNFINKDKQYKVTFLIGLHTPSYDLETPFIPDSKINNMKTRKKERIITILNSLKAPQKIPITGYSAIKQNGTPLYISNKTAYKEMMIINYKINSIKKIETEGVIKKISTIRTRIQKKQKEYSKINKIYKINPRGQQIQLFKTLISKLENNINFLKSNQLFNIHILKINLKVTKGTYIRSIAQQIEKKLEIPTTTLKIQRINTYM